MARASRRKDKHPTNRGDEATIDHLADELYEDKPDQGRIKSPTTDTGLPVEEQVRKEWDPKKGGLPTP